MSYRIYRNLQSNTWTVQSYIPSKGWRKLASHQQIYAPSVEFKIYENGRDRVRKEGRKNVHAFALVESYDTIAPSAPPNRNLISYNPYNNLGFHWIDKTVYNIAGGSKCWFLNDGHIECNLIFLQGKYT